MVFFAQTAALSQLSLFWVVPILGAIFGALIYKGVASEKAKNSRHKKSSPR